MKFEFEKDKILILLWITDAAFILMHILFVYAGLGDSTRYLLSKDRGFAEFFQYTKELWVLILFLILGIKKRQGMFYVFSLLFTYFLVDDYYEIHEHLGSLIADVFRFQPAFGLRAVDLGELLVSAFFGLLFFAAILLVFFISQRVTRLVTGYMFGFVLLLAGFGVIIDMLGVMIDNEAVARVLTIIEEGGEMLVMSVITWFVLRLDADHDELPLHWLPFKKSVQSKNE